MRDYLKFIKVEHTLFSLPVVFSGAILALSQPGTGALTFAQFIWILLAVLGARSMGFALNRIIDSNIDAENPRTKEREIPSGKISLGSAWIFTAGSTILYFISTAMLSRLCFILSPIVVIFFLIYPFLKRWSVWCHLGLGIAWGIAPIGGWLAVRPALTPFLQLAPVLLLASFCVFWVSGFDIIYALLDEEFDRAKGIYSMPAVFGKKQALQISEIFHAIAFLFLGSLVHIYLNHPGSFFFLGVAGLLLVISHWKVQFNPLTPPVIDFAFFKVNAALGFLVFLMIWIY